MAEIAATVATPRGANEGVLTVTWNTLTENDTCEEFIPGGTEPVVASMQVTGTFGGATVVLQGSNDGTNFYDLDDIEGTAISVTAAGLVEFSTSALYIKPVASGGTSQDLDIVICFRG